MTLSSRHKQRTTSAPASKPSGGSGSGGGAARQGAKPSGMSEAQHNTVQLMQQTMAKLKSEVYNKAEDIARLLAQNGIQGFDAETLRQTSLPFGNTSAGGTQATLDGRWGPNTKKSMEAIKEFVGKLTPGLTFHVGEGVSPYKEMDDAKITKIARENLESFRLFFSKLNLAAPEGLRESAKGGASYVLDKVPQQPAKTQVIDPLNEMNQGEVSVKAGNLVRLDKFMYLARKMVAGVDCQPILKEEEEKKAVFESDLTKIASDIFQNSIFKLAEPDGLTADPSKMKDGDFETGEGVEEIETIKEQREAAEQAVAEVAGEGVAGGGAARKKPKTEEDVKEEREIASSDYPCFNQVEWLLNWFIDRADGLYDQLDEALSQKDQLGGGLHPVRGDAITRRDMQAAEWYANQTKALADQWDLVRDDVYDYLADKSSSRPKVTPGVLRRSGAGGAGGGAARRGRYRGRGGAGGRTVSGDDLEEGPLRKNMDLAGLSEGGMYETGYEDQIRALSVGNRLPFIDRDDFMGDWVAQATTIAKGNTNTERIYNYPELLKVLRLHINQLFNTWRSETAGDADRRVVARQNTENRRWQGALKSALGRSSGENAARAAATFRGQPGETEAMKARMQSTR